MLESSARKALCSCNNLSTVFITVNASNKFFIFLFKNQHQSVKMYSECKGSSASKIQMFVAKVINTLIQQHNVGET